MTETKPPNRTPTQAGPARRLLHTFIALAGWVLFAYWWTVVFERVSRSEIRFTILFVLLALVVCVAVTGLWVLHNVTIFRRKGPRKARREVALDYSHDPLGRQVTFESSPEALKSAAAVRIRVDASGKSFRPAVRPTDKDRSAA